MNERTWDRVENKLAQPLQGTLMVLTLRERKIKREIGREKKKGRSDTERDREIEIDREREREKTVQLSICEIGG